MVKRKNGVSFKVPPWPPSPAQVFYPPPPPAELFFSFFLPLFPILYPHSLHHRLVSPLHSSLGALCPPVSPCEPPMSFWIPI